MQQVMFQGIGVACVALVTICVGPSMAAPEPPAQQSFEQLPLGASDTAKTSNSGSVHRSPSWLLETCVALVIVIGLIFIVRLTLSRHGRGRFGPRGDRLLQVVARTSVGPKTQVLFLRINQKIVVVSQTPTGMNTLMVLDDPGEIAWVMGHSADAPVSGSDDYAHRQAEELREKIRRFEQEDDQGGAL